MASTASARILRDKLVVGHVTKQLSAVVKDTGTEWRHWCYYRSKGTDDTQHHRTD